MSLVHVIAVLTAKPGFRGEMLAAFEDNVANVLAEDGCIEYGAAIDTEGVGALQTAFGPDTFVVVEKWQSLAHLKAHGATPHMIAFAAQIKDLMADRIIHVLSPHDG